MPLDAAVVRCRWRTAISKSGALDCKGVASDPLIASRGENLVQVSKGGRRLSVAVQRRIRLVWVGLAEGQERPS
jgi:hypothetical protein